MTIKLMTHIHRCRHSLESGTANCRGSGEWKSPSGVQGQSPSRGFGT